jgi:hypothetical protein
MASLNRENKMVSRRALLLAFASTLLAPLAGAQGDFEQDFFGGEDPDLLPPPGLKAMCQACSIGVTEVWRRTPALRADPATLDVRARREREATAFEVTERGFCAESNFLYYAGSHMVRGRDCKAFLERFNDESQVEERLSAGVPGGHYFDLQNSVCKEVCEYPRPASARRPGGTPPHILHTESANHFLFSLGPIFDFLAPPTGRTIPEEERLPEDHDPFENGSSRGENWKEL